MSGDEAASGDQAALAAEPPESVHTANFPELLRGLGVSLAVTTYEAGKLVFIRAEGDRLNTHFRTFDRPMGLALRGGRLAVGCGVQVWELVNVPAVAQKVEPPGSHDACFLPRRSHVTGDVDVHEMDYDRDGDLWLVNTRFSCLCTLDAGSSFVPRWRPPFVSALAPEDRCHLNGLAMVDGLPRYATALGRGDSAGGWRPSKARGGVLLDVPGDAVLLDGLSMPHSPRWHGGRLWMQESGDGSLGRVDLDAGRYEKVVELPGFTRGLDFAGPIAFVGLSQVRESATFGGLPLTERLAERHCGVYAVDVERGAVVAFLHFTRGVREIFAVRVLHGVRNPELLNESTDLLRHAYVLPDAAMKDVAAPARSGDGA